MNKLTDGELHSMGRHPEYEYCTTVGQRKNWNDAETPPEGEGWERNVDAGRNGWERFDYTEESYWRRKLPPAVERVAAKALELEGRATAPAPLARKSTIFGKQIEPEEQPVWKGRRFDTLNPAIQAMVIAYLTGHLEPFTITDEELRRGPDLNPSTEVEFIVTGYRDEPSMSQRVTFRLIMDGKEIPNPQKPTTTNTN